MGVPAASVRMVRRVSASQLAEWFGVSERQARRWRAGAPVPAAVHLALVLLVSGDLGSVFPAWRGWSLSAETLTYTPSGTAYAPDQLHALPWFQHLAKQAHADSQRQQRHPYGLPVEHQAVLASTCAALDTVQADIDRARRLLAPLAVPLKQSGSAEQT